MDVDDENFRINPDDCTATTDGTLHYAAGDPKSGENPAVVGAAYTNNSPGATSTTLYDIDHEQDTLVR